MRQLLVLPLLAGLAACQSPRPEPVAPVAVPQPALNVPAGAQSLTIGASPEQVRAALVESAQQRGTPVVQQDANMVVIERKMTGANPALDAEFGPSDNGDRIIRVRVRFTGQPCSTLAVQDLAVVNNARTALEQSFVLPGNANTMESLKGLKTRAEQTSGCPAV
ncbi:hypothetical protein GWI72_02795 [Microvirga tunisiensis]|uniref:Uncharacterized protein n=2 Tax=Pannonibacter tanglangensis TaxID=2750084 RepID=A0ABW9ZLE9_9HYPH|nr:MULTISPECIES: hypothetical protein [unclassified Pannonibacter]NBN63555.1 hypothetical protein [Pannonibacter sp. XCT-34]NBN77192.1 hypothetical protein [Pannonibacter sp. XCT-53]